MTGRASKSVDVKFSEATINRYLEDKSVTQLKDPRYPLRLRFCQCRTKASWHLVTYRNNQTYWRKVGNWPALNVKTLINQLPELSAQVAINPGVKQLNTQQFESVSDVLTWYQARCFKLTNLSKDRKATIKSVIKCHLLPALGEIKHDQLDMSQIDELLILPLQAIRKPSTVRLAFVVLKAAFNQAMGLKKIRINSLDGVFFSNFIVEDIQDKPGKISPMMLPALLSRLTEQAIRIQVLVILMLCHATRIGETRQIRWQYIDLSAALMTLPSYITKTNQELEIPLSDSIISLLRAYKRQQRLKGYQGDYLFPGQQPGRAVCASTASKLMQQFSQGQFSAHDFRKLTGIMLGRQGVDFMIIKLIFNHKLSALDRAYFKTLTTQPQRGALVNYHQHLDTLGLANFHGDLTPRSFLNPKHNKPNKDVA